jgi:hypothetical protein
MDIEKEAQHPIFKVSLLAISLFIMLPGIIGPKRVIIFGLALGGIAGSLPIILNNTSYILAALAISYLITLSWHDVFWIYIIAIPVLFLFQHFVDRTFGLHFLHGFSL